MKKWLLFLLSVIVVFSLTACSGGAASSNENSVAEAPAASSENETSTQPASEQEETPAESEKPAPSEESTEAEESAASEESTEAEASAESEESTELEEPAEGGKTLIAYFSWSGNTEQVAQLIAEQTGGDLFEIEPATPYTDDYNTLLDVAQQEQADQARPELANQVENWDSYDVIFLGYPNWWSDAPMAVYTFLESYDFTGKTLVPFNTSSSGGFGRSLSGIEQSAGGATILDGLALTESELSGAQSSVTEWLSGLGLNG